MNHGDPTNSPTGRAHVPGPFEKPGDAAGPHGDAPTGRASVSIGGVPAGGAGGSAAAGRASVGRATVGRATVPAGGGSAGGAGRATVPAAGVVGRATVGRAAVRPSTPSGYVDLDAPPGSDVIQGPGGPRGPRGPMRKPASAGARARRRRRRNWIIGAFAAFIMVAGITVVAGTYYFDDVVLPSQLQLPQSTTIYYADGKTQMAKVGDANRTLIPNNQMPMDVQHAVVSAEDRSFYKNNGIDIKGIIRAAWNNFTGGNRQGASTITQQYARNMFNLKGVSYSRKLREAVIAMKLREQYKPDDIMGFYLNTVYFGRGAYGCEAAAQAYFGKQCKDLTTSEGMVLAGLIKQPEGGAKGVSPYDPTGDPQAAKDRWEYIKQGMIDLKFLPKEQVDALQYPTNVKPFDPKNGVNGAQWGLDKPTGLIVHHVLDELSHAKDGAGNLVFPDLKQGGYSIITTIDAKAQAAAELYASGATKDSPLYGQPANLQAALVAVQPRTGRVIAYYGGPNGAGNDYAGWYQDPVLDTGDPTGVGRHPPGSSFKIYTLAAALIDGYSVNSYWDGSSPKEFPKSGRGKGNPVRNASNANCQAGAQHCMLWEATEQSLNTPFFGVTETLGWSRVVEIAHAAGIRYIWNDKLERIDLNTTAPDQTHLSTEVGIGQFSVTVLDHANGAATIAARGWSAPEHFVQKVYKGTELKYAEQIKLTRMPGYTEAMADDENWALQKVVKGNALDGGRQAAAKSGTWQLGTSTQDNAHAWWVGFSAPDPAHNIDGLATAVWVGNKDKEVALKQVSRGDTHVSYSGPMYGSTMPGPIWQRFMSAALKGSPMTRFPDKKDVGTKDEGNATSPSPSVQPGDGQPCPILGACQTPTAGPTNRGGGGGGGGGLPCPFPNICVTPTPSRRH